MAKKKKAKQNIIYVLLAIIVICGLTYVAFTMLPTNSIVQLSPSEYTPVVLLKPDSIADYSGDDYIVLNNNIPNFSKDDLENVTGENYSALDPFGRCGKAYAMLDSTSLQSGERGDISHIKPTGYKQAKYEDVIDSESVFLYNRGHLIAWALGGDDSEENLTTLTEYTNTKSMLYWENQVIRFLYDSNLHVLYRVTPYFEGSDMVCRGIEMEAYSVEDKGRSICFHVFVYNIEPQIVIDYKTGENKAKQEAH